MSSSDIFFGEILGTAVLILMGAGVVAGVVLRKSKSYGAGWIVIAFGWGLAVMTAVFIAGPLSGAHINPAVTVGIALDSGEWGDVPAYLAGQMLGAMLGATLAWLAYYGHFQAHLHDAEIIAVPEKPAHPGPVETHRPGPVLGVFSTAPEIRRPVQNLTTEIIATAVLVLAVLRIGVNEQLQVTALGGLIVALVVVGLGMSLGGPTGYAINPARDLGPRIVHALLPLPNKGSSDWSYAWIPVAGPLAGAALAAGLHRLLF
ncbi:MIP/aquaporin family protein [Streptomyces aidingensis]|uniref:Glycerol uptake facilitator protein n=1 Tax=Streptomyces aidingensis TaxID=910347 RepID=A0A1I1S5M9_9ACTN|nr:MIP/aquaporin family protein [Streptomyces aidingensis]SFD39868.1 glycerol uptake facilitator protein [Streptomyces aidingensis]